MFIKELEAIINKYSMENASNTPDFILAQYLCNCLRAWEEATQQREIWYGRDARPTGMPFETFGGYMVMSESPRNSSCKTGNLNAEERAEKIYKGLQTAWLDGDRLDLRHQETIQREDINLIAAQIREAEEVANQTLKDNFKHWTDVAFKEGFCIARTKAAEIVGTEEKKWGIGMSRKLKLKSLADSILAMEPEHE